MLSKVLAAAELMRHMDDTHLMKHIIHDIVDDMIPNRHCPYTLNGKSRVMRKRCTIRHLPKRQNGIFKPTDQTRRIQWISQMMRHVGVYFIEFHLCVRLD